MRVSFLRCLVFVATVLGVAARKHPPSPTSGEPSVLRLSEVTPTTITAAATCTTASAAATTISATTFSYSQPPIPSVAAVLPHTFTLDPKFVITDKPTTRTYDFNIGYAAGDPDGFLRRMTVVNHQYPGPLIECNEGDTLIIRVHNQLEDGQAIHWHGISQNGSNWADGVPGVSQCPIPAGSSFTYKYTVSNQYGTFWWHSHFGNTLGDGVVGGLIVHSVNDPIKRSTHFDEERVLFLSDWHNDQSKTIVDALYSPEGYRGSPLPPPVDSVLINGLGQVNCSTVQAGVPCTQQTIPEIAVPKNKRIRFRVINTGTHAQLRLSIDNHELNLVEVDDTPVETVTAHEFPVSNGQRISVIVNTDQAGGAFWMRASVAAACIANQPELVAKAVFRYNDGSNEGTCGRYPHGSRKHSQTNAQLPTTQPWSDLVAFDSPCLDIDNTYPLVPSVVEAAPAIALGSHMFNAAAGQFISPVTGTTFTGFSFNGVPYFNKIYAPFLNEIQQGTPINSSLVANTEFDQLGAYDIIINQLDAFVSHPFHLHGRKFQLIARGEGSITSLDQHTGELMLDNPVRRDTVFIPNTSYAVLRLTTDTPGVWPIHCHIGWHLSTGKLGIIVVRPDVIPGFKNGRGWANLCKGFDPEAWGPQRRAADLPAGSRRNRLSQVV